MRVRSVILRQTVATLYNIAYIENREVRVYYSANLENEVTSQFVEITKDAGHNVLLQASLSKRALVQVISKTL